MHVNRGLLGWGVFFLAVGLVPLAVHGGALDAAIASRAWELWPLLLVGAGLSLALRSTALASLGNIVVGLTFGLMAGGLVVGGVGSIPITACGSSGAPQGPGGQPLTGALGASASVDLSADCGTLTVSPQPGSQWSITSLAGTGRDPDVVEANDSRLRVNFGAQRGFTFGDPAGRWEARLPQDPTIGLNLAVNAGSAKVSLGGAHVRSLGATVNAGAASIDLGGAIGTTSVSGSANAGSLSLALPTPVGTLTGSLSANAGSVRICSPAGVPLRIRVSDQPLGSTNFAQRGMTQDGTTWTRGAWDGAASRIDLTASANLGSITLDPEDGCG